MLWMKVVFHPRYLLHLLILLLLVFFPDYLSQKEMETLHSSIDSGSSLTVAETACKNPSILKSVQNIIENGIEEKCKNYAQKQMGLFWAIQITKLCPNSVLTNHGMNLFLSSHFWLKL